MRGLFLLVAALAAIAVAPSAAVAGGGGGAKQDSCINVQNISIWSVGVIVDVNPNPAPPALPLTPAEFTDKGGVVLAPTKANKFKVAAGAHDVYAVYLDAAGNPIAADTSKYSVGQSQTVYLYTANAGLFPH